MDSFNSINIDIKSLWMIDIAENIHREWEARVRPMKSMKGLC